MTPPTPEQILLGTAIIEGRTVPPKAMALAMHRSIARVLGTIDLSGSVLERVDRIMASIESGERLLNGHEATSWSDLSALVLAADESSPEIVAMALDDVQDLHTRHVVAQIGIDLADAMRRGQDTPTAVLSAIAALERTYVV